MATYTEDVPAEPANDTPSAGEQPNGNSERRSGLSPKAKAGLLIAGAVLLLGGGWYYLSTRNQVTTDNAQVDAHITPVSARISGTVSEVLVRDNQPVKAGQVLVRIDPRDLQARVNQAAAALALAESQARGAQVGVPLTEATTQSGTAGAEAQLAGAEAELSRAQTTYRQASTSDLAYARANIESKRATSERAQADLERMRPLAAKAEISRLQFDAYLAAARVAENDLKAAEERLRAAEQQATGAQQAVQAVQSRVAQARAQLAASHANRKQVDVQAAQAQSAEAAVAQARANLETAQLQLGYTVIIAPEDGVVTHKSVEVGQVLQPGQTFLVLVPLEDVWVTANFKETQLAEVKPGQRVKVHVDMYGKDFWGHVNSIAGASGARLSLLPPENATGNFVKVVQRIPVKIVLEHVPASVAILRPGMNVEATIYTR